MTEDPVLTALARLEETMAGLSDDRTSSQTGFMFLRADLAARVDRLEAALARLSDDVMERLDRLEAAQTFVRVDFSARVDRIEAGLARLSEDLVERLDAIKTR